MGALKMLQTKRPEPIMKLTMRRCNRASSGLDRVTELVQVRIMECLVSKLLWRLHISDFSPSLQKIMICDKRMVIQKGNLQDRNAWFYSRLLNMKLKVKMQVKCKFTPMMMMMIKMKAQVFRTTTEGGIDSMKHFHEHSVTWQIGLQFWKHIFWRFLTMLKVCHISQK